jgi:DNA-binding GntR family transcriptional regulator
MLATASRSKQVLETSPQENAGSGAESLSSLAHRALMDRLVSGELQPNEVITERQLAVQLGISRTPLREAVRRLEGERLLERQRSGVLVVRPLPVDEYMHVLSVRRLLEGEAARLAAANAPNAALEELRTRTRKVRRIPPEQPTPEFAASDRDLHAMIAVSSGNPVLHQSISDLRTRTGMFRFGRLPDRRAIVCDEHIAIIDALLAGDGASAQKAMHAHIDNVRATILERLSGR